jgi:iron complex transport system ATP-binding protein
VPHSPVSPTFSAPIIEISNAAVWRGERLILHDFSLTICHGESLAVLGPNGAGKSTFLKLITGEVRPEAKPSSCCRLFGEDRWSLAEIRHRIGVVMPEEVSRFSSNETAIDTVISSLRSAYGRTREMRFSATEKLAARAAMEVIGVASMASREFGQLSSGEQRRLLIARSLVHQPQLLVLDEPSTALDFAAALTLTRTFRTLLQQGRDLILVTHHPLEIPPEMHRVILLQAGRIIADGDKHKILTSATLSQLYQTHLTVNWIDGWCHVTGGKP